MMLLQSWEQKSSLFVFLALKNELVVSGGVSFHRSSSYHTEKNRANQTTSQQPTKPLVGWRMMTIQSGGMVHTYRITVSSGSGWCHSIVGRSFCFFNWGHKVNDPIETCRERRGCGWGCLIVKELLRKTKEDFLLISSQLFWTFSLCKCFLFVYWIKKSFVNQKYLRSAKVIQHKQILHHLSIVFKRL